MAAYPLDPTWQLVGSFYDITTTAAHSGPVEVCLPVPAGVPPIGLMMQHQGPDGWLELQASVDPSGTHVCAEALDLSQFVLVNAVPRNPPHFVGVPAPATVEQESLQGSTFHVVPPQAFAADGTALEVEYSEPNPYPPGTTTVRFGAVDRLGQMVIASTAVTVVDTTPPAFVDWPRLATAEATGPFGAAVSLAQPVVFDVADPSPTVTNNAPSIYPIGISVVTWTATDRSGNSSTEITTVVVSDGTPPVIASVTATPDTLWPPNHQMVIVTVQVTVIDVVDPAPRCAVTSVTSSEPAATPGSGNTDPDIRVVGALTVELRAERAGNGPGRTYTLTVGCADSSSNAAVATTEVHVPHNQ